MSASRDNDLAEKAQRIRRRRDMSLILPILGILIFFSPIIRIADFRDSVLGVPPVIFYLFGCWLVLIGLTRRLARRFDQDEPE